MRAVFDTSMMVSLLLSKSDTMSRIRAAIRDGRVEICLSAPLVREISDALARDEVIGKLSEPHMAMLFFAELMANATHLDGQLTIRVRVPGNPRADIFLATAAAHGAPLIASADARLLGLMDRMGTPFFSAKMLDGYLTDIAI